jgi:hypothetical protein
MSRDLDRILERKASETLALVRNHDGHAGQIERSLHGSEVRDIDRPRLLRGEAQHRKNALSGSSNAHTRVTLSGSSSALRDERRPVSFTKACGQRACGRVMQGSDCGNVLQSGVAKREQVRDGLSPMGISHGETKRDAARTLAHERD